MAGTIVISTACPHDLRTVDFAWLASELQSKSTGKAAYVLTKVLWPHDEAGMDMLQADELQEHEFKLFARVIREVVATSRMGSKGSAEMSQFLESLLRSIEDDSRY